MARKDRMKKVGRKADEDPVVLPSVVVELTVVDVSMGLLRLQGGDL